MADRYLLESGSPDGYLLEDGSGVLLLDFYPTVSTLTDNLNDNSTDATKWNVTAPFSFNAACTVAETSGQLQITPPTASSTFSYNGYQSVALYSLRGDSLYAALVQSGSDIHQEAVLGFGTDINGGDGVTANVSNGQLRFRQGHNIADLATAISYDAVNHYWLRITHRVSDDHLLLDTAPNSSGSPGTWTNRFSVARPAGINVDKGYVCAYGGTFASVASPIVVIWDGINTSATSGSSAINQGNFMAIFG
jgi:hypothetical protein